MNNFFCEIPLAGKSQSTQLALSSLFSQKFPFQSGPCSTHQSPGVYLWGNVQVSIQEGHSALYLVGEIYTQAGNQSAGAGQPTRSDARNAAERSPAGACTIWCCNREPVP